MARLSAELWATPQHMQTCYASSQGEPIPLYDAG